MKGEPIQNPLRELVWRRKLTEAEHAGLRAQPETQADLELESRLTEALARLPDAPVPSNFTARVLQAVEREEVRGPDRRSGTGTGACWCPGWRSGWRSSASPV